MGNNGKQLKIPNVLNFFWIS